MTVHPPSSKVGRNDPCPCGSGKKYKQCCLRNGQTPSPRASETLTRALRLEAAGKLGDASILFKNVIAGPYGSEERAEAHMGQIRILTAQNQERLAVPHMEQAVALRPKDTDLVEAAAQALQIQGLPEKAKTLAEIGLRHDPGNPVLLNALGLSLERLNQPQEAEVVLRRAFAAGPDGVVSAGPLARILRRKKDFDGAKRVLETALDLDGPSNDNKASVLNELGHLLDSQGNYSEAFEAFEKSGELYLNSAKAREFDESESDKRVDEQKRWILGGGLRDVARTPEKADKNLVFFVGFPRSGTTLTEQVLAAHSQIVTSEERPHFGAALTALRSHYRSRKPIPRILETADETALNIARDAFWNDVTKEHGNDFDTFVFKLPLSLVSIGEIQAIFPSAKVIVGLRDPRDVCLSCFFQNFELNRSMKKFLNWHTTVEFYAKVMDFWLSVRDVIDLPYIEVRYEDTISDLPSQARRILEHIGVDWEDDVLSFYQMTQKKYVHTPSYQAVRENVHRRAVDRWKNYPGAMEHAMPSLRPFIDAFGYRPEGQPEE